MVCPYVPLVVIHAVGLFFFWGGAKVKHSHEKVTIIICSNFFVAVSSLHITGQVLRQRSLNSPAEGTVSWLCERPRRT